MTDEQHHHVIGALVGVLLAITGAIVLLIISDPQAFTQALTTPCNIPECY